MIDPDLIKAYLAARYVVTLDGQQLELRVGKKYSQLAELLKFYDCDSALFITPHNPASEQLNAAENDQRLQDLIEALQGRPYLSGYGVDDAASWPREESLLVLNCDATLQASLAHQFGQNAYVSINRDGLLSLWAMVSSFNPALSSDIPSYREYQSWSDEIASADSYSLLPRYPYPVFIDDGLNGAMQVVAHWRGNFERIVSLTSDELTAIAPVVECYAAWLIAQSKAGGYWCVLSDERMPSDAWTDFIKAPTCIALATLVYLRKHLPQLASQQRKLDGLITKVSRFVMRRHAWVGNGYDRHDAMCDFVDILGRAGVIEEWLAREQEFIELVASLRKVAQSMATEPDAWCGSQAGYSRLDRAQLELASKALSPVLDNSLPVEPV